MSARRPLVLAHRGSSRRARENTLEAFALAREDGADGVELDVHRSRDGVLLVHHDAVIEGLGVLAEHEAGAVRAAFAWIPTLAEVLDECRGLLVNIEIKNSPKDLDFDPDESAAAAVVDLLATRAGADRVLVSSFHLPSIDRVHALAPGVPTGYLTVLRPPPADAIDVAIRGGHGAVHPFFGVLADGAAPAVTELAHTRGVSVHTWTVNEPDDVLRLAAAGVDALITDVPADVIATLS
jgi:glycerophosphoryl diester phosphodiesterase